MASSRQCQVGCKTTRNYLFRLIFSVLSSSLGVEVAAADQTDKKRKFGHSNHKKSSILIKRQVQITGAACNIDADCIRDADNGTLIRTHFCDEKTLTCQPLRSIGGSCTVNSQCEVELYCNKQVCASAEQLQNNYIWAVIATTLACVFGAALLGLGSWLIWKRKHSEEKPKSNGHITPQESPTPPAPSVPPTNGFSHPPAYAPTSPNVMELSPRPSQPPSPPPTTQMITVQEFERSSIPNQYPSLDSTVRYPPVPDTPTTTWAYPSEHRDPERAWEGDSSFDVGTSRRVQHVIVQQAYPLMRGEPYYIDPRWIAYRPVDRPVDRPTEQERWVDEKSRGGITDVNGHPIRTEPRPTEGSQARSSGENSPTSSIAERKLSDSIESGDSEAKLVPTPKKKTVPLQLTEIDDIC